MSDDYKKDVTIDFFNLHLAYRDQAANYMDWAEKWANADHKRDKRRRFLRINARRNPEKYNLPNNPSVAAVNAILEEDEEYISLSYETHIYKAAMDAMYQVRYDIDGLVKLYLNGYFSGPHPSTQNVKEDVHKELGEKVHAAQHEALQKHKKRIGRRTEHGRNQQTTSEDQGEGERGPEEETQGSSVEEG